MIHPIFKTALKRPDLVIHHLANYSELIRCEGLLVQAGAAVLAFISLLVALSLTGVAVMLGVV